MVPVTLQRVTRGLGPLGTPGQSTPPVVVVLVVVPADLDDLDRVGSSPDRVQPCPEGLKERSQLHLGLGGRLIA